MRGNAERRKELAKAVDRYTEFPMLLLAVAFSALLILPWLLDLSDGAKSAINAANWTIWAVFAIELVIKTYLAEARAAYLRTHWFDVLIVVLPFARPLRVIRSVRALRALRTLRVTGVAWRSAHSLRSVLEEHGLHYVLAVSIVLIIASAGAITAFERDSGGNINGFGDALWWAMTTVTTVGYGDRFPVTAEGRAIATFVMLLGISLFSFVTANIAAFLSRQTRPDEPTMQELMEQLRRLESLIQAQQTARADAQGSAQV